MIASGQVTQVTCATRVVGFRRQSCRHSCHRPDIELALSLVPLTWWTTIQVEWMVILLMEHRVVTHHSVLDLCTVVRVSAHHERVNLDARVRNHS